MSKAYKSYQPDQDLLLPPSLKEWLPEKHLAYFVSDVMDELDLSGIYAVYERDERGQPPRLFPYDVTSRYWEGEKNELGEYEYNRDGKRGKLQIVIGLLAVRVFEGHRSDPTTVVDQIQILQEQCGVKELVFVGDRGMVKRKGKESLSAAGLLGGQAAICAESESRDGDARWIGGYKWLLARRIPELTLSRCPTPCCR